MIVQKADMNGRYFMRVVAFDTQGHAVYGQWQEIIRKEYDETEADQVYADGDGIGVWTIELDKEKPPPG